MNVSESYQVLESVSECYSILVSVSECKWVLVSVGKCKCIGAIISKAQEVDWSHKCVFFAICIMFEGKIILEVPSSHSQNSSRSKMVKLLIQNKLRWYNILLVYT